MHFVSHILLLINLVLTILLLWKPFELNISSNYILTIGKLHPIAVHILAPIAIGSILLTILKKSVPLLHKLTLNLFHVTFFLGLLNLFNLTNKANGKYHLLFATLAYISIYINYHFIRNFKILLLSLILICITLHYGGLLHLGSEWWLFVESILATISKYHIILSILPLSLFILINHFEVKRKYSVLFLFPVFLTGVASLITLNTIDYLRILHSIISLSVVTFLFLQVDKRKVYSILTLSIISGVFAHYGLNYFISKEENYSIIKKDNHNINNHNFYLKKIKPILNRKCVSCHNSEFKNESIDLSNLEAILRPKNNKQLISFYNPNQSLIYNSIIRDSSVKEHMPFLRGNLTKDEINIIYKWINEKIIKLVPSKNVYERQTSINDHWFFDKFYNKNISSLTDYYEEILKSNSIKYKIKSLQTNVFERKLTLSLTGLIPKFFTDRALKINTQTLLESQFYCENFATKWFDYSGFSQTTGLENDKFISGSESYKLEVLNFFMKDYSYLDFLKQQLQLTDNSDNYFNFFKYQPKFSKDPVVETQMASHTLFSFTLGFNLKCAKCHNHKYAPITNEDYYQTLTAISNRYSNKSINEYKHRINKNSKLIKKFLFSNSKNIKLEQYLTENNEMSFYVTRSYVEFLFKNLLGKGVLKNSEDIFKEVKRPRFLSLLNWLTNYFIQSKYSTKKLITIITDSKLFNSTYYLSDSNFLLQSTKSLSTEEIRDNLLLLSNSLDFDDSRENKNPRSFYLERKRSGDNFLISKGFTVPKGVSSIALRKPQSDYEYTSSWLDKKQTLPLINKISTTYRLNKFNIKNIQKFYIDLYNRNITKNEISLIKEIYKKEIDNPGRMFTHISILSSEFLEY